MTTPWLKIKKDEQTNISTQTQNTTKKTEGWVTRTQPKPGGDPRCSGRVTRSCLTCGTQRVAHFSTNPVISIIQ